MATAPQVRFKAPENHVPEENKYLDLARKRVDELEAMEEVLRNIQAVTQRQPNITVTVKNGLDGLQKSLSGLGDAVVQCPWSISFSAQRQR